MRLPTFKNSGDQIVKAILYLRQAPDFIRDNKLWKGYLSIGWISKLCIFIAIIFSYKFITGIVGLFTSPEISEINQQQALSFFERVEIFGDSLFLSGSMKYLIVILLETVIFHFAARTNEILTGENLKLTVNDFISAQIRMIKVAIRSWIFEIIIGAILITLLKLVGLDILSKAVYFVIQFYFLGLAFIDNYNEQYKIPIKESFGIAYDHFWASIIIGVVAYLLFLIPLFGIILGPFICAVGSTTYMHYARKERAEKVNVRV